MEEKMNKYGIVLDGKMDEPVWSTVPEHTRFRYLNVAKGELQPQKTFFRILPCEDRIYIGVKCMEPDGMAQVETSKNFKQSWSTHNVEIFLSPTGTTAEYYQFIVTYSGRVNTFYYRGSGERGSNAYAPDWKREIYIGEDYWSCEVEIPLTAFYMTPNDKWNAVWLGNIARTRVEPPIGAVYSSWVPLKYSFLEPENFRPIGRFPMRPASDDVRISSASVQIEGRDEAGYRGIMQVKVTVPEKAEYEFTSDHGDPATLSLTAGDHEFAVPCLFEELYTVWTSLSLRRLRDGKEFKCFYPVHVTYKPINLHLTQPEYRDNFYPGQDCSKVIGTAVAASPVILTLEGDGVPKQTVTAAADGSFRFDTPDFAIGEAILTATIDGFTVKKKIRRLAPTGHTMTWISGGNLIVDGEPVLARTFYGDPGAGRCTVAFDARYLADDFHLTPKVKRANGDIEPRRLIKGSENGGVGEALRDQIPSDEMFARLDSIINGNKDRDFAFYYLSDEPESREVSPVYLQYMYEHIKERDPYHVVMIVNHGSVPYLDCADWFQTHPYIFPETDADGVRTYRRPLHMMGGYIDEIVNLNRPDKCIGFLPTCFAHKWDDLCADFPTFDEIIGHTWAAMIHGGKTLWPYVYDGLSDRPALYEGFRYLFSSFEALEQLVLHGKRTTLTRSEQAEAVLYDNGSEKMFVLVNYTQEPQTVRLKGLSGTWHNFRHCGTITDYTFRLDPLETVIGTNTIKDTGLPSYTETAARIDRLEFERTHRGSLLFDRTADVVVTTSSNVRNLQAFRLFDGMVDNLGMELPHGNGSFVELDIRNVGPKFSKVVIHGYNLAGMKLLASTDEMPYELPIADTVTEKFSTTYFLSEKVSPDVLRLEFSTEQKVEIYEIEVF